jgi:uncharacterized protein with FMN-binding domain
LEKKKLTFGKVLLRIFLALIALLLIIIISAAIYLNLGMQQTLNLPRNGLVLESVADGTYEGSYNGYRWSNTVLVTVKDHAIESIEETKSQQFTAPETIDALIAGVISAQDTKIDGISGATVSSNAFFSAVEDAVNP